MKYLIFFLISTPAFAAPAWIGKIPTQEGYTLEVVCHGSGPDDSTAFASAMNECRNIAAQTLLQNFHVKDLTIQTERDSAYHNEVAQELTVDGLKCAVKQMYTDGSDKWVLCRFDTSKAKVTAPVTNETPETLYNSEDTYVVLVVAPDCDSILVVGKPARIIRCTKSPVTVTLRPGDEELIVRNKGYAPKHIKASQWQSKRVIAVYLDRL